MGSRGAIIQTLDRSNGMLKDYAVNDPSMELKNIDDYYSSTAYEDMMCACLL